MTKVTTKILLNLNEHPFAEGETLSSYADRQALALGVPGSLLDVRAGLCIIDIKTLGGAVCKQHIDSEWIEMEFERVGPPKPEVGFDVHVIEFNPGNPGGWAIEHPLKCRNGGGSLFDCDVHAAIMSRAKRWYERPVLADGRYIISFALDSGDPEFTLEI